MIRWSKEQIAPYLSSIEEEELKKLLAKGIPNGQALYGVVSDSQEEKKMLDIVFQIDPAWSVRLFSFFIILRQLLRKPTGTYDVC